MLPYHAARMERTLKECLGIRAGWRLEEILPLPGDIDPVQKCRILYGKDVFKTEWQPYQRTIHKGHLLVHDDTLDYRYKYADRQSIEKHVLKAPEYHDVIIVRDGMITDASYSNLVFYDGEHWVTPAKPLLPGVMRAYLLDSGTISERDMHIDDLRAYPVFKKINALNPLESAPVYFVKDMS